jgi:hypothetical protein
MEHGELKPRRWTVMVYMAAGDSPDLDAVAVQDLREMERGVNEHAHVVAQINRAWPDAPQRYLIEKTLSHATGRLVGGSEHVGVATSGRNNMGDQLTLSDFLKWAVPKYPAEHYMLVLWGHAYGLGFGRDHGDSLTLVELTRALRAFENARDKMADRCRSSKMPVDSGPIDILGANSCAMSYLEAAFELHKHAKYLVASQITVPFAGWPYDAILSSIDSTTTPESLGLRIVRNYTDALNLPLKGHRVQMAMLNLGQAEQLDEKIRRLAKCLRDAFIGSDRFDSVRKGVIRDTFLRTATGEVRPLIDLINLCTLLREDVCESEKSDDISASKMTALAAERTRKDDEAVNGALDQLKEACRDLIDTLTDPSQTHGNPLVVESRAHPNLSGLNGVGIFAPFVTDQHDLKRLELDDPLETATNAPSQERLTNRQSYERLSLFTQQDGDEVSWPTLVYDDLNEPVPEELLNFVAGVGVQQRSDRADIIQIILAVESSFNRLDRLLERAQSDVLDKLRPSQNDMLAELSSSKSGAHSHVEPAEYLGEFRQLRLLPPLSLKNAVMVLELRAKYTQLIKSASSPEIQTAPINLIRVVVAWLRRLEEIVEQIETATHKGLTHSRFGLGPAELPRGFAVDEPPKSGEGPPTDGLGAEPPKSGEGLTSEDVANATPFQQAEIGTLQVRKLFERAAVALRDVERSIAKLELQAREALTGERQLEELKQQSYLDALVRDVSPAFAALCESASNARRTIRGVVAHPLYGLGPSASAFALDQREELAFSAGFSQTRLRLLVPRHHFDRSGR